MSEIICVDFHAKKTVEMVWEEKRLKEQRIDQLKSVENYIAGIKNLVHRFDQLDHIERIQFTRMLNEFYRLLSSRIL